MRTLWALMCLMLPVCAYANSEIDITLFPVPQSPIMRGGIIAPNQLSLVPVTNAPSNAITDINQLVGQQAKRALPAGKPILLGDIAPPVLVKRNDVVTLVYQNDLLLLSTSGRALGEGGLGASISVMNTASRKMVTGIIQADGTVRVQSNQQGASNE